VERHVRYLSETVSSLPVHTYRDIARHPHERADPIVAEEARP
jgi:hypothetical protein